MLSKRNYFTMMVMNIVVLVLFLFSSVLKEYFNDYHVNHAAQTDLIEKIEFTDDDYLKDNPKNRILYIGDEQNEYSRVIKEWAEYRKKILTVIDYSSLSTVEPAESEDKFEANIVPQNELSPSDVEENTANITDSAENTGEEDENISFWSLTDRQIPYLLIDGQMLENNTETSTEILSEYVKRGGVVIFYRLPSYQTINNCENLKNLLGIQHLRAESVKLHEIRIYSGFMLGGETCYSFEGVEDTSVIDIDRNVPWYDISSGTKSYMVGFVSAAEKAELNLNNEDMPAIIWRNGVEYGSVFAVNGDYMKTAAALGMLDAMVYESEEYYLYPVVNAQNLVFTGFPGLSDENEEKLTATYGMAMQQFSRDVLWPSFVAAAQKNNWKITSFISFKQNKNSSNEPSRNFMIEYLKYFNEESAEAGVSLGEQNSDNLRISVEKDKKTMDSWDIGYQFSAGHIGKENKSKLSQIFGFKGQMRFFSDIRTVVGDYEDDLQIISWLTDSITLQNATADAYRHTYRDSLMLKSIQTSLGYSNIQADIFRVLWPQSADDNWEKVAEKMAANIDTFWKPFSAFDKTTITESDRRVRNLFNISVQCVREQNKLIIKAENFEGEAYLLLRTHGEIPQDMTGGSWIKTEDDAYILKLTSNEACVTLKPKTEYFYKQ